MFYTIITWYAENEVDYPPPPTAEQRQAASDMIATLSGDFTSELTVAISNDRNTRLAMRTWPTEEIAQSWVDFSRTNFNGITTAVVSATPADLSDYTVSDPGTY